MHFSMRPTATLLLLSFVVVAGCADNKPRVPQTSGGSGGGSAATDAAPRSADANQPGLSGRLCQVTNMQTPFACANNVSLANINVAISGQNSSTVSAADGSFSLPAPDSSSVVFEIGFDDNRLLNILVPIEYSDDGAADISLPVVTQTFWDNLLSTVGAVVPSGSSSLAVYLTTAQPGKAPISGAELFNVPGATSSPFYDGPNGANDWRSNALTGERGASLLIGVPNSTSEFRISTGETLQVVAGFPLANDALTIVSVDIMETQ